MIQRVRELHVAKLLAPQTIAALRHFKGTRPHKRDVCACAWLESWVAPEQTLQQLSCVLYAIAQCLGLKDAIQREHVWSDTSLHHCFVLRENMHIIAVFERSHDAQSVARQIISRACWCRCLAALRAHRQTRSL